MMKKSLWRAQASVLIALLALAGCGGGGGGSAPSAGTGTIGPPAPSPSPTPTPTPTPTPPPATDATDRIVFGAAASQTFATEERLLGTSAGGLTISFEAPTGRYLVATPADTTARALRRDPLFTPISGSPWTNFVLPDGFKFLIRASGDFSAAERRYLSSNLAAWAYPGTSIFGVTAFGIPTPAGAVAGQGMVTYTGFLEGGSGERFTSDGSEQFAGLLGTVTLVFDFASGTAHITIDPLLYLNTQQPLPQVTRTELVWAAGAQTFHQPAPPQSPGSPPVSGRFTGPAGEELIGSFQLNYVSPVDGSPQTARAAFIAKRTS